MRIFLHDQSGHPFQVQLARELARRGHKVRHLYSKVFPTPRGALERRADDPADFEVVGIDPKTPFAKYSYVKRYLQQRHYGRLLQQELEAFAPDVALMSNTPPDSLVGPQRWCRTHGVGFVFWVQDIYSEAVARLVGRRLGPVGSLLAAYYRRMEAGLLRRSDQVVSITDDFIPVLEQWGIDRRRISTIENWSPLEELPQRAKDNSFALEQGLQDKTVLLYSGTLGLKHNPALLLAIAEAFKDDPSVVVVVVSEGLGASWLAQAKAEHGLDRLRLLPFQPFARMPDVLGSADVLLAILEADAGIFSVPSKVLTYFCAGKPMLAAMPRENLAARTILRADAGLVVAPDDMKGFVSGAVQLVANPTNRAAHGAHARRHAERAFDIRLIGERFEDILAAARIGDGASLAPA